VATIAERDDLFRRCWRDTKYVVPDTDTRGPAFGVTVLGVIQDRIIRVSDAEHYIDWVTWWPATRKWTVTHTGLATDPDATVDFPVNVTFWQPMLPLPWI
jgi:hypothetical protein